MCVLNKRSFTHCGSLMKNRFRPFTDVTRHLLRNRFIHRSRPFHVKRVFIFILLLWIVPNFCLKIHFKYALNFLLFSLLSECQQTHKHKIFNSIRHWICQRNDEPAHGLVGWGESTHTHTAFHSVLHMFSFVHK